jgi:serine/threonine protein kinase
MSESGGTPQSQRATPERIGRYRLINLLGSGGMGDVYLAQASGPHGFGKTVALKVLRKGTLEGLVATERFFNEARLAATLDHPNIVQIFDFGKEGEDYFMAMEYAEGATLATLQERLAGSGGSFTYPVLAAVASQVSAALNYMGSRTDDQGKPSPLVHRDISPDNIILTRGGQAKLLDFGIAKDLNSKSNMTQPGFIVGKPWYLSPEQVYERPLSPAHDVYALGVTLWECARLEHLYDGTPAEVLERLLEMVPARLIDLDPRCPPEFSRAVEASLRKDSQERPTAKQLKERMDGLLWSAKIQDPQERVAEFMTQVEDFKKAKKLQRTTHLYGPSPSLGPAGKANANANAKAAAAPPESPSTSAATAALSSKGQASRSVGQRSTEAIKQNTVKGVVDALPSEFYSEKNITQPPPSRVPPAAAPASTPAPAVDPLAEILSEEPTDLHATAALNQETVPSTPARSKSKSPDDEVPTRIERAPRFDPVTGQFTEAINNGIERVLELDDSDGQQPLRPEELVTSRPSDPTPANFERAVKKLAQSVHVNNAGSSGHAERNPGAPSPYGRSVRRRAAEDDPPEQSNLLIWVLLAVVVGSLFIWFIHSRQSLAESGRVETTSSQP